MTSTDILFENKLMNIMFVVYVNCLRYVCVIVYVLFFVVFLVLCDVYCLITIIKKNRSVLLRPLY